MDTTLLATLPKHTRTNEYAHSRTNYHTLTVSQVGLQLEIGSCVVEGKQVGL